MGETHEAPTKEMFRAGDQVKVLIAPTRSLKA